MSETTCNHCGQTFDDQQDACPYCRTPTPKQQNTDFDSKKKRFMLLFIALIILCAVMIVWLPRVIR